MNKMNSKYILKVDVGGQIFKTNVNTLCKYPNSMLCAMFSHTNSGLTPMPKTEKGHFFLDADPIYFRVILNWLRLGKVTLDNPGLLKGTIALAEYFGLDELTEELKMIEKKNDRKYFPEKLYLCTEEGIHNIHSMSKCESTTLTFTKTKLARVPESRLARYLNGEECHFFPIAYDFKSGYFVINSAAFLVLTKEGSPKYTRYQPTKAFKKAFEFLEADSEMVFTCDVMYESETKNDLKNEIKEFLHILGIEETLHYVIEEFRKAKPIPLGRPVIRHNAMNWNVVFHWNQEYDFELLLWTPE